MGTDDPKETTVLARLPLVEGTMAEFLDRLAAWQRAWGVPVRAFNE
jgi:hypothetical protein